MFGHYGYEHVHHQVSVGMHVSSLGLELLIGTQLMGEKGLLFLASRQRR